MYSFHERLDEDFGLSVGVWPVGFDLLMGDAAWTHEFGPVMALEGWSIVRLNERQEPECGTSFLYGREHRLEGSWLREFSHRKLRLFIHSPDGKPEASSRCWVLGYDGSCDMFRRGNGCRVALAWHTFLTLSFINCSVHDGEPGFELNVGFRFAHVLMSSFSRGNRSVMESWQK